MTDLFSMTFIYGALAGFAIAVLLYFVVKFAKQTQLNKTKTSSSVKEVVVDVENMEEVQDFDESNYTKGYFEKTMHSIQIDEDWKMKIDQNELSFSRSTPSENGRHLSISADFRYSFKEEKNSNKRTFYISSIYVNGSSGAYSDSYRLHGEADKDMKVFLYKKYLEWKNKINDKKRQEIDDKLKTFSGVLGKSVDRDMKLDKLLEG